MRSQVRSVAGSEQSPHRSDSVRNTFLLGYCLMRIPLPVPSRTAQWPIIRLISKIKLNFYWNQSYYRPLRGYWRCAVIDGTGLYSAIFELFFLSSLILLRAQYSPGIPHPSVKIIHPMIFMKKDVLLKDTASSRQNAHREVRYIFLFVSSTFKPYH